ncbi:uncharacterized protein EV154DRAFT_556681 [Mucor mucedo]|uniref:uncharacterized protein n=1 Tax=Mucor mucedo TaxID=29922 RepID=UPI0022208430|nr:uncharacterized protein EV154DRAFT_556681 [Mucor mucedo]KAI7870069.1 hypothetical protein EV154DRAFT_556681 [Mucor mucedo]
MLSCRGMPVRIRPSALFNHNYNLCSRFSSVLAVLVLSDEESSMRRTFNSLSLFGLLLAASWSGGMPVRIRPSALFNHNYNLCSRFSSVLAVLVLSDEESSMRRTFNSLSLFGLLLAASWSG